jgi:hypothetical protein
MMTTLEAARDALAQIDGVMSCRIGIEEAISPADYPLIRIVPDRITPGRPYDNRTAACTLYFGMPIANAEGLEAVYSGLFDLESGIRTVLRTLGARYLETIMDSDRLPTYKMAAIRCEIGG